MAVISSIDIDRKLQLEHQWHESEDFARDANSLMGHLARRLP
jgi:hypothetical protein